ncbi:MAG: phage tail protein [Desulfatitalea sp.]|nr:tail fiber protein [Desulfatitalea sp.]NNK01373.1 phage tail protein [Desulfatitalea sp.]
MPADPYYGEICIYPYPFAPEYWALCEGQLLSVSQHTALFSLLGTAFGGNGVSTFGLPDLRGRFVLGEGTGPGLSTNYLGQMGGREEIILSTHNLPSHSHTIAAECSAELGATQDVGTTATPGPNCVLAQEEDTTGGVHPVNLYADAAQENTALGGVGITATAACHPTGSDRSTDIRNPYMALKYCIAIIGTYPQRN